MRYEKDAKKILEEFSQNLEKIPKTSELFYDIDDSNVLREDGRPVDNQIYDKFMKIAPRKDKKGNILAERMKL